VSRQLIAHQDLTPLELFDMRANVSENNSLHDAEAEQARVLPSAFKEWPSCHRSPPALFSRV
ncbi:MAG: hypothetical protein VW579_09640, partial [Verrucomicrobiales bacterium]